MILPNKHLIMAFVRTSKVGLAIYQIFFLMFEHRIVIVCVKMFKTMYQAGRKHGAGGISAS